MNPSTTAALLLAIPLVLLGLVSGVLQMRGIRQLRARSIVPSDERSYLARRYRRRMIAAVLITIIGALIGGAYLSGMESRADALAEHDPDAPRDASGKRIMQPEERQFVRTWGTYWVVVIFLVFAFIGLALLDMWATTRYWLRLYQQMREDHQTKLRRDLAVYRQHKDQQRSTGRDGYGGRLGTGAD